MQPAPRASAVPPPASPPATTGVAWAMAAGALWGLVFAVPTLLPDYPPAWLAVGRYLAFGLVALVLAGADRTALRALGGADWMRALELAAIGNLLYYTLLAAAIQLAGGPLATIVIGTLPLVIAACANRDAGARPWRRLAPSLLLIAVGIAAVHGTELARTTTSGDATDRTMGVACAVGALACWTWYPIRNAGWLQRHPGLASGTWATAQGLATLPLALAGAVPLAIWLPADGGVLGPRPETYAGLMLALGLLASWGGTLCWNLASQRLPTSLTGQLIVFETIAALAWSYGLRGSWPEPAAAAGIACLLAGVVAGVRALGRGVATETS